jgi:hypothetical protein
MSSSPGSQRKRSDLDEVRRNVYVSSAIEYAIVTSGYIRNPVCTGGNYHNDYTSGTEVWPLLGSLYAQPALQRHLAAPVDRGMAALVPERVMVRAVGHWSNTTSVRARQCSHRRAVTRVDEASAPNSDGSH